MPLVYAATSLTRQRVPVRWMVKLDMGADGGIAFDAAFGALLDLEVVRRACGPLLIGRAL